MDIIGGASEVIHLINNYHVHHRHSEASGARSHNSTDITVFLPDLMEMDMIMHVANSAFSMEYLHLYVCPLK